MITVIADDLTGAAEIAGVCLRYGLKVSFGIDSVPDIESDVRVVATDSRSGTVDGALRIHRLMASKALADGGDNLVFKKTDSVLRGYIVQELKALMLATGKSTVLLQPANPLAGRCIRQGNYYVDNVLLEETGFSTDPDFPATTSDVKELLDQRARVADKAVGFPILTGSHTALVHKAIYVPDCESVGELSDVLNYWNSNVLLAGSAAFFEQILLKVKGVKCQVDKPQVDIQSRFLLVCGTAHPKGREFLDRLKTDTDCPVRLFPPQFLQETISDAEFSHWAKSLIPDWKWNKKMAISLSPVKVTFPDSSAELRRRMNSVVSSLMKNTQVEELLIEGGATAYSVLNFLQWKTLIPEQELEPGVIRMRVSRRPSLCLTVKPGSYSWPSGIAGVGIEI